MGEQINWNRSIPNGYAIPQLRRGNYQLPWGPAHTPLPGYESDSLSLAGRTRSGFIGPPGKQLSPAQRLLIDGLKIGLGLTASIVGGAFGGPLGAVIAGSLVSGSITAIETKWQAGKVDLIRTLWDGAWGALPGFGGFGSKIAARLTTNTSASLVFKGSSTFARGLIQGFFDGAAVGFFRGGFEQFWTDYQNGIFRPGIIFSQAIKTAGFSGFVGGTVGGVGNMMARSATHNNPFISRPVNQRAAKRFTSNRPDQLLPDYLQTEFTGAPGTNPNSTSHAANRGYTAFQAERVLSDMKVQKAWFNRHTP